MNKGLNLLLLLFSIGLALIGVVILLNSLELSRGVMSEMMAQNGGSMNTDTYHIYLREAISNFRTLGTLFVALGGSGLLLAAGKTCSS